MAYRLGGVRGIRRKTSVLMKVFGKEWIIWLLIVAAILFFVGIYTGNEILLIPLAFIVIIVGVIEWWIKD